MGGCSHVLSIDVGSTGIKAGVVDCRSLEVKSSAVEPAPVRIPRRGWAEQDPGELWESISRAANGALEEGYNVDGVVFSTYLAGLVLLDQKHSELTPIIMWLDERGAGLPKELFSGVIKIKGYNLARLIEFLYIAGGAPGRSGKDPLSKLAWLAANEAEAVAKARVAGGLKTWVLSKVCRLPATTPDEAHLTWLADTRGGRAEWSTRLARRYGVPLEKLPRIVNPAGVVCRMTPEAARDLGLKPNVPVVAGAGDVASAALGSGSIGSSEYHVYVGTSSWVGVHVNRRIVDVKHYIGSILSALPGLYLLIGENEVAGAFIDKILSLVGESYGALEEASKIPPGSRGLLMAPWLLGERSPIDDPHVRGVILGLDVGHGKLHLVRAAMEAVALNIAWTAGFMYRLAGKPRRVRGVGGGFESRTWASIIASALGTPIEVVEEPRLAALKGAAILAVSALSRESPARVASKVKIAYTANPDPEASQRYRGLLKAYIKLYGSLKNIFKTLGSLAEPG